MPLRACMTTARDARLDYQEACAAIPPGPDRGACMRDCALEGTGAFGAASLALFRFAGGPRGTGLVLALSILFWLVAPGALALRRLRRADI